MPFDSLGTKLRDYQPVVLDPLLKLGIVPVPKEYVVKYKKDYAAKWRKANPNAFYSRWQSAKFNPEKLGLRVFLSNPTRSASWSSDRTAAPEALVDLALHVQEQLPEAGFSVDYFYDDPVLHVIIDGQKSCLGIWDRGRITAIAKRLPS